MNLRDLPKFWPNSEYSRFIKVDDIDWHVQIRGTGPALLMIHGTGASTHSWAALADKLANQFTLVMPDLPGQGFSSPLPPEDVCIEGYARGLQSLLSALEIDPKTREIVWEYVSPHVTGPGDRYVAALFEAARIERLTHARVIEAPEFVPDDLPGAGPINAFVAAMRMAPDYAIVARKG